MHVLLLTSLSEGLPLAVLEAQACGVPALSTPVGACKYVCYDCFECDGDLETCADRISLKIEEIVRNWDEVSKNVRAWTVENFDLNVMVQEYGKVFKVLARGDVYGLVDNRCVWTDRVVRFGKVLTKTQLHRC
jgi:glycosyltransferase involved in cell wall biosynthesis